MFHNMSPTFSYNRRTYDDAWKKMLHSKHYVLSVTNRSLQTVYSLPISWLVSLAFSTGMASLTIWVFSCSAYSSLSLLINILPHVCKFKVQCREIYANRIPPPLLRSSPYEVFAVLHVTLNIERSHTHLEIHVFVGCLAEPSFRHWNTASTKWSVPRRQCLCILCITKRYRGDGRKREQCGIYVLCFFRISFQWVVVIKSH